MNVCKRGQIKKGVPGVWEPDDDFDTNGVIYFSCPLCAFILRITMRDLVVTERNDRAYSLNCLVSTGYDHQISKPRGCCGRHLWMVFEDLPRPIKHPTCRRYRHDY